MATLLQYSEQQAIKPISNNNQSKYLQITKEVEELELKKLLGIAFLQAIQANPTNYSSLLNGGSFTNSNNETISFKGLKYVIAYMNYSKYLSDSNIVDTFSGFRSKNTAESDAVPEGTIRRLQEENRKIALTEFEVIKEYLNLNAFQYPLWKSTYQKIYRPRIYGVRKVDYGRG